MPISFVGFVLHLILDKILHGTIFKLVCRLRSKHRSALEDDSLHKDGQYDEKQMIYNIYIYTYNILGNSYSIPIPIKTRATAILVAIAIDYTPYQVYQLITVDDQYYRMRHRHVGNKTAHLDVKHPFGLAKLKFA